MSDTSYEAPLAKGCLNWQLVQTDGALAHQPPIPEKNQTSSGKDPAFQMEGQGFDHVWAHLMDIQVMERIWALSRVLT
ncbi:hypothetical protein E3N88_10719 [Mikania micrantha]|uniref:Uncharacterized protein n=1 Tax=Mikania micrantha TaxID=192012 RepID=A0A5N6PCE6_9ASTR|nr:hypothetical protein E3N88_10719 [Mikania micrantha]